MSRYVKAFTIFAILLASVIAYPSSYAQSDVLLNLEKRVYSVGESVIISGIVQSPSDNVPVIVQVWNPRNEACSSQQVTVGEDGSFIVRPIKLSGRICSIPGTYTVNAFYGEHGGNTSFEVQPPTAATQNTNERLQALLEILNKAKQNIDDKIRDVRDQGIEIPDDVMQTYESALVEVQETENAADENDANAAKEHARKAMSLFREIFAALSQLEGETEVAVSADTETTDLEKAEEISKLRQAIVRAIEFKNRLANIAQASNIKVDSGDFDTTIEQAAKYVEEGSVNEAANELAKARQILSNIQKSLMQESREQRELKAREFVEKTVKRIDEMIENAKEIGLSQDIIDALENAKAKLLAAKNINEIIIISKELKEEKDEFAEEKGKNFERAIKHIESKLEEAKHNAEQIGINAQIFDRIQALIDDTEEQWAAGETRTAVNMLEKAERILNEIIGTMERARHLLTDLEKIAQTAEELKAKAGDNREALNAIEKAMSLINGAKETLRGAKSQDELLMAHNMYTQAKRLLEMARHMLEGKVTLPPTPAGTSDADILKRMAQSLEQRAEKLMKIAEEQENKGAINVITEAMDVIRKAKQMISKENYDDAKSLLRQAEELLNRAERMLARGTGVSSKPSTTVSDEQAKKDIMQEIQVLETVAADLKGQAGDNEKALNLIEDAIEDLEDAKELVREGELENAKSKVNDAKENLRKAKAIIDSSNAQKSKTRSG